MNGSTILQKVIEEIKADPTIRAEDDDDIIIAELCNRIQDQEMKKMDTVSLDIIESEIISGANMYLILPVPYQKSQKEVCYIALERDPLDGWSVCYYVDFGATGTFKMKNRHIIESTKPNHIVTGFAKVYKAYLGKETKNL
jgi:hypothetical protein